MSMHLKYARYVIRHKWFVFLAGLRYGVSLWALIVHDWSKFLPSEWFPYARYFYGNYPLRESLPHEWKLRATTKEDVSYQFDIAWLHHQNVNPHHWQWWILNKDDGSGQVLRMPERFVREMLADWSGAGQALGHGNDSVPWYLKNKDKMQLHPDTRNRVEQLLGIQP